MSPLTRIGPTSSTSPTSQTSQTSLRSRTGRVRPVAWQGSLFDTGVDRGLAFDALVRHQLDDATWVDEVTAWAPDHGELFALLLAEAPWKQRERRMYDRMVLEPRMVATWGSASARTLPPPLEAMRAALSDRYRVEFDSVGVNLYRDGRDGVAWHGDTNRRTLHDPLVATVSLGERRRFLLRPGASGSPAHRFQPGGGDLLVMGGACQHRWQHTVPKEPRGAGARMSVTLRHSREGWWVTAPPTALVPASSAVLIPARPPAGPGSDRSTPGGSAPDTATGVPAQAGGRTPRPPSGRRQ